MTKRTYGEAFRPICCWLTPTELEQFRAIARHHNVSPTSLLRATVIDVIADESERVPLPRRRLQVDVFSILRETSPVHVVEELPRK